MITKYTIRGKRGLDLGLGRGYSANQVSHKSMKRLRQWRHWSQEEFFSKLDTCLESTRHNMRWDQEKNNKITFIWWKLISTSEGDIQFRRK